MEIGQKFNQLSIEEYFFLIDNYKKIKTFNTLGLYRSLLENDKLNIDKKIEIRNYAHKTFIKTFDFLQLKDPKLFVEISTLGEVLTNGDIENIWKNIKINQQKILADKKIKHRNFGTYSRHNCGNENCIWNGVMIRQGSWLTDTSMHFITDKNKYEQKLKSDRRKADRKNKMKILERD